LAATDSLEGDGVDHADLAITVRVDIRDGVFHVDFTVTAPAARGNVNCPLAVARSAVLFVVRTLLPADVPTNGGVERAVRVTAPEGCLVNARHPSAVAAGHVETSQRIEVLELEYPLRVRGYALRWGSGGAGKWAGGDGVIREFEALMPMEASILAERRRHAPQGAAGGGHGAPGRTILNGTPLPSKVGTLLEPGDVLRIETPGGGGWGTPG